MVFSSTLFLFMFLPVCLLGYALLKGRLKNVWLLCASLLFFSWSQPNYLWIILLSIAVNYTFALFLSISKRARGFWLILAIAANLSLLFYFKYFDFTIKSINDVFGTSFPLREIVLPIGISFFTFQGMSYVIDVYKKDVPCQKNVFKLALYITLFPQLIAGPIVRYRDVAGEIDRRSFCLDDISNGISRFIIGLSKKAIIANTLAEMVDSVWAQGSMAHTCSVAWVASIAYTLQIYFDFSGYSDMAIGLGQIFGFHFNENFDFPYISRSISEFWRRWHISLSTWFRDYVYIPLGGNRRRVYRNLFIIFLLTGIWHGAAWHFVIWGIWNGFFILLERFINNRLKKSDEKKKGIKCVLLRGYTLLVVNFGWILFRAPTVKEALQFIGCMVGKNDPTQVGYTLFWYLNRWTFAVLILGVVLSGELPSKICCGLKEKTNIKIFNSMKYIVLLVMLYASMLRIVAGTYNPFIYFQF